MIPRAEVLVAQSIDDVSRRIDELKRQTERQIDDLKGSTFKMTDNDFMPVSAIRLHRIGDYAVVSAEIAGTWIELIREHLDGSFGHIIEYGGMRSRYYAEPASGDTKG